MKIFDEMKDKCSWEYTLKENLVLTSLITCAALCAIGVITFIILAIAIESFLPLIAVIILSFVFSLSSATLSYIDPDW